MMKMINIKIMNNNNKDINSIYNTLKLNKKNYNKYKIVKIFKSIVKI